MYGDYALIALICGALSALIAKYQGRNSILWFLIGSAGSFLGLLIVIFLKKKIKKEAV